MTNHQQSEQGWAYVREGRMEEARAAFALVLQRDANYASALHGLGFCEQAFGRMQAAEELIARAIQSDPKRAMSHMHLGGVFQATKRLDAAIASLRRAVALDGQSASIALALAMVLSEKGLLDDSLQACAKALALDPNSARALGVRSHLLCLLGDAAAAEISARRAVELAPYDPISHMNLGIALDRLGQSIEAESEMRRAIALGGDIPENHLHLANVLLRRGDFSSGWDEYEWRFAARPEASPAAILDSPAWDGGALGGKALLVQQEQGMGDVIQMSRFLPRLTELGGRVILRCQPALVEVMRSLDAKIEIAPNDAPPPVHDLHVPIMRLPRLLGVTLETIPAGAAYLRAEEAKIAAWAAKLPARDGRLHVGVVWAGNAAHVNDRNRSIRASDLAALAAANDRVVWISLQKDADLRAMPLPMIDVGSKLRDFSETAAVMANLDLIVTVDTAGAHLAGALGRPVWTLLPFIAEWRWLTERADSPWYPSMRLFRQKRFGDWAGVLRDIAGELRGYAGAAE